MVGVRAGGLGLWKGGMQVNVWVDFGGIWWTGVKGILEGPVLGLQLECRVIGGGFSG